MSPFEICLTLEGVEDGKEVHERQVGGAPSKKCEAPGKAEQDGKTDSAAQLMDEVTVLVIMRVLPFDSLELNHNEYKDYYVDYKYKAEVGHHCHVEDYIIIYPAARK